MRVVGASGTPFEVGRRIGTALRDLVERAVEAIARLELEPAELERRLDPVEARLRAVFPETLEEVNGLAEGAGVSRTDALVLSVASDIHGKLPGGCSLMAVPAENGLLVGKNLDTSRELGPLQVVQRIRRQGAYGFAHVTCAGAMWTDGGVNEAGLVLVNSSLAAAGTDPGGVPDGILARELLARCSTVSEAVALAEQHGVMSLGETLILADVQGRSAAVETLPGGRSVRAGGTLIACNHPLEQHLVGLADAGDPIRANSERRLAHLGAAASRPAPWTFDAVAGVLGSEAIYQDGDSGLWTVASLIASPAERRLWVTAGGPAAAHSWTQATPLGQEEVRT